MPDADQTALRVKPGCAIPVPDTGRRRAAASQPSVARFVEGIRSGDRSLLARAITLIESSRPADRKVAEEIIEECIESSGNSIRVGVTGVPGAGKSSLIESLGKHLITHHGENVAVLAIDPSSRVSGGSILGDKTRMPFLGSSAKAFIRPSPSRGIHGGVAQHTREAILLCEAAGFQNILVETVGVGQSEAAVRDLVDVFLLVTIPGAGDELQGIKRGVMEMANVVVVNKADGENLPAAERARMESENAQGFLPAAPSGWKPRAIACSAHTGRGVAGLWSCILDYVAIARETGWFERARREQVRHSMHEILERGLMQLFRTDLVVQERMFALENQVIAGQTTSTNAVRELLALFAARAGTGTR